VNEILNCDFDRVGTPHPKRAGHQSTEQRRQKSGGSELSPITIKHPARVLGAEELDQQVDSSRGKREE